MKSINGIVISSSKYKDNDAIINVLTSEEIVPIIIRGAYRKNSKHLQITKCFIDADFEIYQGPTKYWKLKDAKINIDYNAFFEDYNSLICVQLIKELFSKSFSVDSIKNYYLLTKITLKNIKEHNDSLKYTLLFIAYLIRFIGYGLDCNSCKVCGSVENFKGLSFSNGGFVCNKCFNETQDILLTKTQIIALSILFNNKYSFSDSNIDIDKKDTIYLIKILCNFISYFNNISIISKDLF